MDGDGGFHEILRKRSIYTFCRSMEKVHTLAGRQIAHPHDTTSSSYSISVNAYSTGHGAIIVRCLAKVHFVREDVA
jgi:hypothetical protein